MRAAEGVVGLVGADACCWRAGVSTTEAERWVPGSGYVSSASRTGVLGVQESGLQDCSAVGRLRMRRVAAAAVAAAADGMEQAAAAAGRGGMGWRARVRRCAGAAGRSMQPCDQVQRGVAAILCGSCCSDGGGSCAGPELWCAGPAHQGPVLCSICMWTNPGASREASRLGSVDKV